MFDFSASAKDEGGESSKDQGEDELNPRMVGRPEIPRTITLEEAKKSNRERMALDRLREIRKIDDPVRRLKEVVLDKATQSLFGLASPPEVAMAELAQIQDQSFEEIQEEAESQTFEGAISYLGDVLFKFNTADDLEVNGTGIIEKVEQRTKHLQEHLETKRERQRDAPSLTESNTTEEGESSKSDRWRHLARAVKVLERCPNATKLKHIREQAEKMQPDELKVPSNKKDRKWSEDPWGAIQAGLERLREDLSNDEEHELKPKRYHGGEGIQRLVDDLVQGNDVSDSGSSEQNSE